MRFTYWRGSNPERESVMKFLKTLIFVLRMVLYNPFFMGGEHRLFHRDFDYILISILRHFEELETLQEYAIRTASADTGEGEDVTDGDLNKEDSKVHSLSMMGINSKRIKSRSEKPPENRITIFYLEDDEQEYNVFGEPVIKNEGSTIAFLCSFAPRIQDIPMDKWESIIGELLAIMENISIRPFGFMQ
ncbi:unnamed protein product [Orchesella dallaii]|uniref:Uncharacterized protein n=1 Tax=Orchesella dallaii TaxID=48710 RepID=A0ABP1QH52_9HEXA